jgi:Domain of unknown function (DUF4926)
LLRAIGAKKVAINTLDVVALLEAGPRLGRGQVGTVVEKLAAKMFEVEFNDDRGQTYVMLAAPADKLLVFALREALSREA